MRSPGDTAEWPDGTDPAWMGLAVEAVVDGYCRFRVLTQSELKCLADAVRFRPLVIAAREFAASIERGEGATPDGWWTRYAEAETVAAHAQAAMERHREPIRESS